MTKIDQFESIFRAATKEKFEPEELRVDRVLILTDKDSEESKPFVDEVQAFLQVFSEKYQPQWDFLYGPDYASVAGLLETLGSRQPDLICTYRNLHTPATEFPYSLGVYVDVLTQATEVPILLMPRMELQTASRTQEIIESGTTKVMAITDHLAGDHHLVNVAAKLVSAGGKLLLTHVEDRYYFDRFLGVIDKIAEIDSDIARETILNQLLSEPKDYVQSARAFIEKNEQVEVVPIVEVGHLMKDHLRIIEENDVDLLILHTKDDDQLAMHGLAYPLAVELREQPMLMI
jgi:hypothetical protein